MTTQPIALPPKRFRTADGHQIVTCGIRSYSWDGEISLDIGDQVLVPADSILNHEHMMQVTSFGTRNQGALVPILKRLRPYAARR